MFNDKFLLTQAVLEGRKTQTRRIVSQRVLDNIKQFQEEYYDATFDKLEGVELFTHYFLTEKCGKLPYNVGEVIAVAQSYRDCGGFSEFGKSRWEIIAASVGATNGGWNSKRFVRATFMPHRIRITDFRVEKLQDISEKDAILEGITYAGLTHEDYGEPMFIIEGCKQTFGSARDAYAWMIDKISSKGTWQSNPYVFVYDFELVK